MARACLRAASTDARGSQHLGAERQIPRRAGEMSTSHTRRPARDRMTRTRNFKHLFRVNSLENFSHLRAARSPVVTRIFAYLSLSSVRKEDSGRS